MRISVLLLYLTFLIGPSFGQTTMYPICLDGKWGYMDVNGKILVEPQYDRVFSTETDYALVRIDSIYQLVHHSGEIRASDEYDFFGQRINSDGLILAKDRTSGKHGQILLSGQIVVPFDFDYVGPFFDGYARAIKNGKQGVLSIDGHFFDLSKYSEIKSWNSREGCFVVIEETKKGEKKKDLFSAKAGKVIVKPDSKNGLFRVHSGRAIMSNSERGSALIDITNGSYLIDFGEYDYISIGTDSVYTVKCGDKYGFIDFELKELLNCSIAFHHVSVLNNGLAAYMTKSPSNKKHAGLINRKNEIVLSTKDYSELRFIAQTEDGNNLYWAKKNSKAGILDATGKVVVPFKYDSIYLYGDLFEIHISDPASSKEMVGYLKLDGTSVWGPRS